MSVLMMLTLIVLAVFVLLPLLYLWSLYNGLVASQIRIKEAWSGINVQLKRRADLIPNLIETVKGYAKHERELLSEITKARSSLLAAKDPQAADRANNMLSDALKSLFAVAENYPQLKANENFKELQRQLEDTEDKVAYARQFYNTNVLDYNTKIQVFPNVLLAGVLGFKKEEFFGISEEDKKEIKVKF